MNNSDEILKQAARLRGQIAGMARRLRQEAQLDPVQFSQLVVMGAIDRMGDGVSPTEICAAERIRSSNLAVLLRELESVGYIKRRADAHDRRRTLLSLTAKGRRVLHGNRTVRGQWLARAMLETLSARERSVVLEAGELLDRLARVGRGKSASDAPDVIRKERT